MTSRLRQQLKADLTAAMKTQNKPAVLALRAVLAEIDHAEAVEVQTPTWQQVGNTTPMEVPRKVLTAEDIWGIVVGEMAARQAAVAEYEQLGQTAEAETQRAQLAILQSYLNLNE